MIDDIKKDLINTAAKNQNAMKILISFRCTHNCPLNNGQKLLFVIDDIKKDLIVTAAKNKIAVSVSFSPTKGGPLSTASLLNKQKDRYNIVVK